MDENFYLGINFCTKENRLIKLTTDIKKLSFDVCSLALNKANKCVIILEIEALPHQKFSIHSKPNDDVVECLGSLL